MNRWASYLLVLALGVAGGWVVRGPKQRGHHDVPEYLTQEPIYLHEMYAKPDGERVSRVHILRAHTVRSGDSVRHIRPPEPDALTWVIDADNHRLHIFCDPVTGTIPP